MAMCNECKQEMSGDNPADSCIAEKIVFTNGDTMIRSLFHFDEPNGRCHDCGIKHGGYHHPGCDVERCPKCGGQLISCNCFDSE